MHEKKVEPQLIAYTLGTSVSSINRIITIMEATKNGEALNATVGSNYQSLRRYAKEFFGVATEPETQPAEKNSADEHNTAAFMVKVLEQLEKTNALLERLCRSWGCEQ